ncbi:MAG TPA: LD-carboxypeptidase [Candidatus Saccharimonadales bacterium]
MKPMRLKKGDKVALISPSNPVNDRIDVTERAIKNFEGHTGLEVVVGKHALGKHYYGSGTKQERLDDFHEAIANSEIKAVLFSVGGSVAIDLVEEIDYELVRNNPKIISGISDGTTLLTPITKKTGLITFLGLEFLQYADFDMKYQVDSIQKAWFEGNMGEILPNPDWVDFKGAYNEYKGWQTIQEGSAEGIITGGNATCFGYFLNTSLQPDLKAKILVLEGYMQPKREIHRVLKEYKLRGAFDDIAGLVLGYWVGADDQQIIGHERPFNELVIETVGRPDLPILQIGEAGHHVANIMLPIGANARFSASDKTFEILESVTKSE